MIRLCLKCGKAFEAGKGDSYCSEHAEARENERTRRRDVNEPARGYRRTARWKRAAAKARARDDGRCTFVNLTRGPIAGTRPGERCSRTHGLDVHHVQALAAGGAPYSLANLATVCRAHHRFVEGKVPA